MAVGNNSTLDTTELMTGKDGKLFVEVNGVNTFLAEINEFKVAMNANTTEYHNNLIYTATVDEDKQRIWGNNDIKQKFNIFDEADCVDILLNAGTKSKIVDKSSSIC